MRTNIELVTAMVAFSTFVHAAPAAVPQEAPPASLAAPALTGVPDTTVKTSANAATATGTTAATAPGNTASADSSAPGEAKHYDCSFFKSGGQPSAFPDPSKWLSGEQLWQLHLKDTQKVNADAFTDQTAGLAAIKTALIDFPWSLGIPELEGVGSGLFVAKAIQESTIRANPPCTNAGTTNCGILQGPQGSRKFDKSNPEASLKNVVEDAIKGKNDSGGGYSDGFLAALQKAKTLGGSSPAELVAIATRLYNSGLNSLSKRLDLNAATAASTPSYVSDMANILTGWVNDGQHGSYADCKA
ncbi:hypothetical protein B9Z65_8567 [Elsinoe australis]|uniref:Uncharacterized protein n=1 Tax=Elsinoe australis TaxID=40998 RepID=A0A2P7YE39_9PEZI|nr:hypothetical protein B9Z65_8567 [Elsinoe australis]